MNLLNCNTAEDLSSATRYLRIIIEGMNIIGTSLCATEDIRLAVESFNGNIQRCLEETELRVAIGGETNSGKTTLLNSLFNTNMFYITPTEATVVPTEIRYGDKFAILVLDEKGNVKEELAVNSLWLDESGNKLKDEYVQLVQDFVRTYTRIDEQALSWVSKIKVNLPVPGLPASLVLIDTPGFNAHEERTQIVKDVISNCHACIFVMDARNAIKMEKFIATREELSKMFLVLNKMDLVQGDDELDRDGTDATDETLKRIRREFTRKFNVEDILLYPVSSLSKAKVSSDAYCYVDNLVELRVRICTEILRHKLRLIAESAPREALAVSRLTLEMSSNLRSHYQNEIELAVHQEFNVLKTVVAIINEDCEALRQWGVQTRWTYKTLVSEQTDNYIKEILILVKSPLSKHAKEVNITEEPVVLQLESSATYPQSSDIVESDIDLYIEQISIENDSRNKYPYKMASALILALTIAGGTLYYTRYASACRMLQDAQQNLDQGTLEQLIVARTDINEVNSMLWPNPLAKKSAQLLSEANQQLKVFELEQLGGGNLNLATLTKGAPEIEELAQQAKESADTGSELSNDQIVLLLNNAGKQFVKVWFSGSMNGDEYFALPDVFNSPKKLENFYDKYWTKNAILKLTSVNKYIQGIYSGPMGNAEVPEVISVLNKKLSGNQLTVSVTFQNSDGPELEEFTLVSLDGTWKINYAPWFTSLPKNQRPI